MHDAVAVAAAAGLLHVHLAPLVDVEVDTTQGPGRGQTIADLRGVYRGHPDQPGAHCRVLLDIDTGIVDEVVGLISDYRG
jgi:purine nucleosidase